MARIVFVTWNGGGNLSPALGIAVELSRRQHKVTLLGQESQRPVVEPTGLAFLPHSRGSSSDHNPQSAGERLGLLMRDVWLNTAIADDVLATLSGEPADLVVVDCMLEGVLARSVEFGIPVAVLVHGLFHSVLPMRDSLIAFGNRQRVDAGLPALDVDLMTWENRDLVVVTTLREFDGVEADPAPNVRYVGPVFPPYASSEGWRSPWETDDPRPLVLVSLSTMVGQSSPEVAQWVLDALGGAPVRVLMTSGEVPPEALSAPSNAKVFSSIPHQAVLPDASLMLTHAGHGSVMGALAHGVPLVCMPGVAADQPIVAQRVESLGAGRSVSLEAPASELLDVVNQVLGTNSYAQAAERMAHLIQREDGPRNGALALESCLAMTI